MVGGAAGGSPGEGLTCKEGLAREGTAACWRPNPEGVAALQQRLAELMPVR